MSTGENKCIRYLMKEMDPSEELEFEHLMREDENLLIEVESLRAINKKFSKLPFKNPPKKLTQKIAHDAKKLQSSKVNRFKQIKLAQGIAAGLLVAVLSGSYFYFQPQSIKQSQVPEVAATEEVKPWVDRNEILSISNMPQGNAVSSPSSILDNDFSNTDISKSYEKLQLVKFYNNSNGQLPGMHLTGTSK